MQDPWLFQVLLECFKDLSKKANIVMFQAHLGHRDCCFTGELLWFSGCLLCGSLVMLWWKSVHPASSLCLCRRTYNLPASVMVVLSFWCYSRLTHMHLETCLSRVRGKKYNLMLGFPLYWWTEEGQLEEFLDMIG